MRFSLEDIDASDFTDFMIGGSKPPPTGKPGSSFTPPSSMKPGASSSFVAPIESEAERRARITAEIVARLRARREAAAYAAEEAARAARSPSIVYIPPTPNANLPSIDVQRPAPADVPFYKKPVVIVGALAAGVLAVVLLKKR